MTLGDGTLNSLIECFLIVRRKDKSSILRQPMKTKIFCTVICSFALACLTNAEEAKRKHKSKGKGEQTQPVQHGGSRGGTVAVKPKSESRNVPQRHPEQPKVPQHPTVPGRLPTGGAPHQPEPEHPVEPAAAISQPIGHAPTQEERKDAEAQSQGFRNAEQYRVWKETGKLPGSKDHVVTTGTPSVPQKPIPFRPQHFNFPGKPDRAIPVIFKPHRPIEGSPNWHDPKYKVFREYDPVWRDRDWWKKHCHRIVFILGGWYYWNTGYWFPAWGYDSNAVYAYDGPVFAYNDLSPDQVVANVQAVLQQLGYYHGVVNGWLDALTQDAIAAYQRDHGLYITAAVDEPTLASLGMA